MAEDLALLRITATAKRRPVPTLAFPEGQEPHYIDTHASDTDPLPAADVLIVTYTAAEGEALADILTPGLSSKDWTPYRNNWAAIEALIEGDRAPSRYSKCSGSWALIEVGTVKAVVLKSDLHPDTDGPKLPIATAWKQWVSQVKPTLVISTGTAGAVQGTTQLGDVVVSRNVSWDCRKQFKNAAFAGQKYDSSYQPAEAALEQALTFVQQTSRPLPTQWVKRTPQIWVDGKDNTAAHIITTDFFAFDDAENSYGLRTFDDQARAVEMDDAAMALAVSQLNDAPAWLIVRNASDPQMPQGTNVKAESKAASDIYLEWGQVTSWGSAVVCWALTAALGQPA